MVSLAFFYLTLKKNTAWKQKKNHLYIVNSLCRPTRKKV